MIKISQTLYIFNKFPNIKQVKSEIDSSNFDKFEEEEPWIQEDGKPKKKNKNTRKVNFTSKIVKKEKV